MNSLAGILGSARSGDVSLAGSERPHCRDVTEEGGCVSVGGGAEERKRAVRIKKILKKAMHGFQSRACGAEVTLQARGWIYLAQFLNPSLTHSAVASSDWLSPLRCRAGTQGPYGPGRPGEGGKRIGEFGLAAGAALLAMSAPRDAGASESSGYLA